MSKILYNDGKWDGLWDLPKYQEMREKIVDSFKGLTFVEEGHKYFLNGKEITCVSNVTHMFQEHFDAPTKFFADSKAAKIKSRLETTYPNTDIEYGEVKELPEDLFENPSSMFDMATLINEAVSKTGIDSKLKANVKAKIQKQLAEMIKARGFGQHRMKRHNVEGYEKNNIMRALLDYTSGAYGWMTKMDAALSFSEALTGMNNDKQNLRMTAKNFVRDMLTNTDKVDRAVAKAKEIMFVWFLGGNFKTAFVNSTQVIQTGIPVLSVHAGAIKATTATAKASKDFVKDIITKGKTLTQEEHNFLNDIYEQGLSTANFLNDINQATSTGAWNSGIGRAWGWIAHLMGLPMAGVEHLNRATMALATYRLAKEGNVNNPKTLQQYGMTAGKPFTEEAARKLAVTVMQDSNFVFGKASRPAFLRGGKAGRALSSAYTFRSFTHSYVELLYHLLRQRDNAGRKAVAMMLGATITLGGLTAIPLYASVMTVLRQVFGDGDDPEREAFNWIASTTGKNTADAVFYGLPALVGLPISGSLAVDIPMVNVIISVHIWNC